MKPQEILNKLKPTAKNYKKKIKVLNELIQDPTTGHILDNKLVRWAERKGLNVSHNCEDKISWFTVNAKKKK